MVRRFFFVALALVVPTVVLAAPVEECAPPEGSVSAPSGTWTRARFVVDDGSLVDDMLVFDTPAPGLGSERAITAVFLWKEGAYPPRLHLGAAVTGGELDVQSGPTSSASALNAATPCSAGGASVGLLLWPGNWSVVVMTESESGRATGSYAIPGHPMEIVDTGATQFMGPETMTCDANARLASRSELAAQALIGCEAAHVAEDPAFFLTHVRRARDADHTVDLYAPNAQKVHIQRPNVAFAWRAAAMPGAWSLEIPRWVTTETGAKAEHGADSVIGVFAGVPLDT
ncbi:MAG TPA: hypothetical protein VM889_04910 [Candidatus Thermoplasmatota archaeon]|nr:hypothetical protein [Candidatus Thermoplasmatota archaeon]